LHTHFQDNLSQITGQRIYCYQDVKHNIFRKGFLIYMIEFGDIFNDCAQAVSTPPPAISAPDLPPLPSDTVVAMAYVPFQQLKAVYSAQDGLMYGTMFPCLNKPFLGKAV
jgi:hypothetical protein